MFASGCFLFELVMKTEPFKSSNIKDEHYSKLAQCEQKSVSGTSSQANLLLPTDFKGTNSTS